MSENVNGATASNPDVSEARANAKSSLNAVKCLTGNFVLFAKEDANRYRDHIQSYESQFQPIGPEECALVQSIADVRWRLNAIPGLEQAIIVLESAQLLQGHPQMASPEAHSALELEARRLHEKELRHLALQENRLSRRREREVAEVMRLQAARKEKEEAALAEAAKASLLAQHKKEQLAKIPGLGFVFTKTRFATFMSRLTLAQKAKLLQDAINESAELPQTMEAVA